MTRNSHHKAFSLIELLVVITIIVMLVAMMGVAMNSARASGKRQQTKAAIAAIDAILQRHFASCESTPFTPGSATNDYDPGISIRQKITADMPDSWEEVRRLSVLASGNSTLIAARQRGYIANLNALAAQPGAPGVEFVKDRYASSECLFMIVMQGGLGDCIACSSLDGVPKGDKDLDGALEFLDAWGEPIQYVLWPAGFELPVGEKFFSQGVPFTVAPSTGTVGGSMRPLVVSGGADKATVTAVNKDSNLVLREFCGRPNPSKPDLDSLTAPSIPDTTLRVKQIAGAGGQLLDTSGNPTTDSSMPSSDRPDNITNYDDAVKK